MTSVGNLEDSLPARDGTLQLIQRKQTRNRFGELGSGSALTNGDQPRGYNGSSLGHGFSNGTTWSGGIWGTTIGSGLKTSSSDSNRPQDLDLVSPGSSETKTGSGSLLSSSESESWVRPHNNQWPSINNISPGLQSARTGQSSTSPVRLRQNGGSTSPFLPPSAIGQGVTNNKNSFIANSSFLDPTSGSFKSSGMFDSYVHASTMRHGSEDSGRRPLDSLVFGSNDLGQPAQIGPGRSASNASVGFSGYNSSTVSRSGSLPPSRHGIDQQLPYGVEHSTNMHSINFGTLDNFSHRPNQPSRTSTQSTIGSKYNEHASLTQYNDLASSLGKLDLGRDIQDSQGPYYPYTHPTGFGSNTSHYSNNGNGIRGASISLEPENRPGSTYVSSLSPPFNPYRAQLGDRTSYSPGSSDLRRSYDSPAYSNGGTPPLMDHQRIPSNTRTNAGGNQAAMLERKLQELEQGQHVQLRYQTLQQNTAQYRQPFTHPYDNYNPPRMSPAAPYYPVPSLQSYPPNIHFTRTISQQPPIDSGHGESLRSTLLEEFRSNNKGTKRYELKDIYDHVVEFSGDQHGSRFIQQKLENANSDEKEQIFREILPNSLQLMTDVFGNYVIQKFFEHGNQSQKKVLANQMKGHILDLSLQMYGCRVVQKAFEHILTDQQASLVKELEHQVLKCVKDQNGNHVVQKAIERIPAEHIQFILNAFTGQIQSLATHPYGCRVVQRMLEHCQNPSRKQLLEELHACAPSLIIDQYGNYVTQHVIEHGDPEDRVKIISLITAQLIAFSKHKFASNVVEKSIQFGSPAQRQRIIATLTALDDKGESPLLQLMKDQYGNYVIQKLLLQLRGTEYDAFVEVIKPQLQLVKRFSYGKQVGAIEKLVYTVPTPPILHPQHMQTLPPPQPDSSTAPTPPLVNEDAQSPQSSSAPSTNTSTVDGPVGNGKDHATAPVAIAPSSSL